MVTSQLSTEAKSLAGSRVNVIGPPETVAVLVPLSQTMLNQLPVTFTGSLNVTLMLLFGATPAEPDAGAVLDTAGALSGGSPGWAPSARNVSVANPSHSVPGVKTSEPSASPVSIAALRLSV